MRTAIPSISATCTSLSLTCPECGEKIRDPAGGSTVLTGAALVRLDADESKATTIQCESCGKRIRLPDAAQKLMADFMG
jgi:RNase P subunit RPR2